MPAWRRSDRCRPIGLTPTRFGPFASDLRRGRGGLVGLGRPRVFSGVRADVHSPGFRTWARRPAAMVLRLGVNRPRPPAPVRSNRRRRVLRANLAAPARHDFLARRRYATVTSRRRRQGRSGASLEVWFPFSTCRSRRVCPADASRPDHPASAFRHRPARCRSRFRWRPPLRFCAGGDAGWCLRMWRTFRSSFWRLTGDEPANRF